MAGLAAVAAVAVAAVVAAVAVAAVVVAVAAAAVAVVAAVDAERPVAEAVVGRRRWRWKATTAAATQTVVSAAAEV